MSGGVSNGAMTLQDFLRLYQPTALPVVQPTSLAPLGQPQPAAQAQQSADQSGGSQGRQGGGLSFLGQLAKVGGGLVGLGPNAQTQSGQASQSGIPQMLGSVLQSNGANGTSNMLANVVGFDPFGGGGWGSGE